MKNALLFISLLVLSGCAPTHKTTVITPPKFLTRTVEKPTKPNPQTATQKDVAIFIIEINAALDMANIKLQMVEQWSEQWNNSTKQKK